MKKIVMATLLAATAFASHAQVSISGKASVWVDSTKVGAASTTSLVTEPTSNITFSVSENLGGGVKARGVLETSLVGNSYSAGADTRLGDRQSTIGLASKFGSIDFGRNVHSQFLAVTNNDAFGTLYGSVAGYVQNLRDLRLSNGAYVAVNVTKDVAVSYDRSMNGVGIEADSYGVTGSFGGVNVSVAEFKQGSEKSTTVGANVKFGATQLFASHSDDQGVHSSKGDLVGAKFTNGPVAYKVSYGKTNTNIKAYSLGADYALSKRTSVGVAYSNVNFAGSASDVEQVGVGITHRF